MAKTVEPSTYRRTVGKLDRNGDCLANEAQTQTIEKEVRTSNKLCRGERAYTVEVSARYARPSLALWYSHLTVHTVTGANPV